MEFRPGQCPTVKSSVDLCICARVRGGGWGRNPPPLSLVICFDCLSLSVKHTSVKGTQLNAFHLTLRCQCKVLSVFGSQTSTTRTQTHAFWKPLLPPAEPVWSGFLFSDSEQTRESSNPQKNNFGFRSLFCSLTDQQTQKVST